jgi:hypothetical protein
MPNHVTSEVIFLDVAAEKRKAIRDKCVNGAGRIDFEILLPTPINSWRWSASSAHEKTFPYVALDWCTKNWGTKWNAYGKQRIISDADTLTLHFDTAWRPPYGWLLAIFNTFEVSFDHNWLDEGAERGVSGKWRFDETGKDFSDPWIEKPCDDEMQKHLHVLRWGVESFDEDQN